VTITADTIHPNPALFFDNEVSEAIRASFFSLPPGIYPLYVKEGSKLYFRRAYEAEATIRENTARLLAGEPLHAEALALRMTRALAEGTLSSEQAAALLRAAERPLAPLYGGPGTGKTYCAGLFLKFFLESCSEPLPRVALTGPTGKATANLEKMVHRALGDTFTQYEKQIDVHTLHALLGRRRNERKSRHRVLSYDLIIIDESSMIGAELMASLLSSVGGGVRLLFLGDPNQLPPIEGGCPFSVWYEEEASRGTLCELSTSHRAKIASIVEFARSIRDGDGFEAEAFLAQKPLGICMKHVSVCDMQKVLEEEGPRLCDQFPSVCFLSPCKEGPWGCEAVNSFFALLRGPGPIIVTKNDYDLDLMNGEIGYIEQESAIFPPRAGHTTPYRVPLIVLSQYSPAFCLSVHKSQGSEFERVVLLLPPQAVAFGKKMVYTGVTRAKKEIEIWSAEDSFRASLS